MKTGPYCVHSEWSYTRVVQAGPNCRDLRTPIASPRASHAADLPSYRRSLTTAGSDGRDGVGPYVRYDQGYSKNQQYYNHELQNWCF